MLPKSGSTKFLSTGACIQRLPMETQTREKVYEHYDHADACRHARWTARECYQFMYNRPWQPVVDFYSSIVHGSSSLCSLFGAERPGFVETPTHEDHEVPSVSEGPKLVSRTDRTGRWARVTFKVVLSYHGCSFDGWQKQPGLNTVQGLVEKSLGRFLDDRKVKQLQDKSLPLEGCAAVAGRTDKGVTALNQVCSFYTWREDIKAEDIEEAINNVEPGKIKAKSISKVSRVFHPNFSAKWRRYLYIFPVNGNAEDQNKEMKKETDSCSQKDQLDVQFDECKEEKNECSDVVDAETFSDFTKPRSFSICRVNQLLQQLEGKILSYKMFARDTKASRNTGPPTECFIFHARAAEATLPIADQHLSSHPSPADTKMQVGGTRVMCVELIANRFLRKMVRVLVATSIREAAAGAEDDALLKLMDATSRRATAPPAPPDGLCLVDVGYRDYCPKVCLMP